MNVLCVCLCVLYANFGHKTKNKKKIADAALRRMRAARIEAEDAEDPKLNDTKRTKTRTHN